jgi:hypothetical protein
MGVWYQTNLEGNDVIECPDDIRFMEDGSYNIINECYGMEEDESAIEKGDFLFDENNRTITLKNRIFLSKNLSFYQNRQKEIILLLKTLTDEEISFCLISDGECNLKAFKRK